MTTSVQSPLPYQLPDTRHVRGDVFDGIIWRLTTVDTNDLRWEGDLALVRMQWKGRGGTGPKLLTSEDPAEIEILDSDPRQWWFRVKPFILDWPVGEYTFAIELTDDDDFPRTVLTGKVIVIPDPVP